MLMSFIMPKNVITIINDNNNNNNNNNIVIVSQQWLCFYCNFFILATFICSKQLTGYGKGNENRERENENWDLT